MKRPIEATVLGVLSVGAGLAMVMLTGAMEVYRLTALGSGYSGSNALESAIYSSLTDAFPGSGSLRALGTMALFVLLAASGLGLLRGQRWGRSTTLCCAVLWLGFAGFTLVTGLAASFSSPVPDGVVIVFSALEKVLSVCQSAISPAAYPLLLLGAMLLPPFTRPPYSLVSDGQLRRGAFASWVERTLPGRRPLFVVLGAIHLAFGLLTFSAVFAFSMPSFPDAVLVLRYLAFLLIPLLQIAGAIGLLLGRNWGIVSAKVYAVLFLLVLCRNLILTSYLAVTDTSISAELTPYFTLLSLSSLVPQVLLPVVTLALLRRRREEPQVLAQESHAQEMQT